VIDDAGNVCAVAAQETVQVQSGSGGPPFNPLLIIIMIIIIAAVGGSVAVVVIVKKRKTPEANTVLKPDPESEKTPEKVVSVVISKEPESQETALEKNDDLNALKIELAELQDKMDLFTTQYAAGEVEENIFNRLMGKMKAQKIELERKLLEIMKQDGNLTIN